MALRIGDLARNDVEAAVAYAREYVAERGPLPPDEAETLYMLQDDPAELGRQLRAGLVQAAPTASPLRYPSG